MAIQILAAPVLYDNLRLMLVGSGSAWDGSVWDRGVVCHVWLCEVGCLGGGLAGGYVRVCGSVHQGVGMGWRIVVGLKEVGW